MEEISLKIKNHSSIENYFIEYDKLYKIDTLNLSSKYIFFKTKKELEKRKINFRICDFIYLFEKNLKILALFIANYHKVYFHNLKLNNKNFTLKSFSIKNFYSLSDVNKFETIFDKIVLQNPKINKIKYFNFFKEKRSNIRSIKSIKYVDRKDLIEFKKNKKLKSKIKFITRRKKTKIINIIIFDLEKKELDYLFKILSVIFRNSKFKIYISKDIYKFTKNNKSEIFIFLSYSACFILKNEWLKNNKYILSIKSLEDDLYSFLSTKPNILFLSKNTKNLIVSDRKSIYNKKFFVSNRIVDFIDLLRKGGNEFL